MTDYIIDLLQTFWNGQAGYAGYLWYEISHPNWGNYFYWLIGVSLFFFLLEWYRPWRQDQPKFRKDFWIDVFYMFFNFFLFSLLIYNGASDVVVKLFNNLILAITNFDLQASNPLQSFPMWAILIIGFILRDFVQWWVHRLLHAHPRLWEFHKVHHSVEQMGFAAHLRYHWMENVVYRSLEYIPLALIGIGLYDFFVIHIFSLTIGHYNHSNISVSGRVTGGILGALIGIIITQNLFDVTLMSEANFWQKALVFIAIVSFGALVLGPIMKYIFNSPEMHIWHHAYELPKSHPRGINFGISLALWDYIFGTAVIPHDGKDIRLGFPEIEKFPKDFVSQMTHGIKSEAH